jgi:hypothetical protein
MGCGLVISNKFIYLGLSIVATLEKHPMCWMTNLLGIETGYSIFKCT